MADKGFIVSAVILLSFIDGVASGIWCGGWSSGASNASPDYCMGDECCENGHSCCGLTQAAFIGVIVGSVIGVIVICVLVTCCLCATRMNSGFRGSRANAFGARPVFTTTTAQGGGFVQPPPVGGQGMATAHPPPVQYPPPGVAGQTAYSPPPPGMQPAYGQGYPNVNQHGHDYQMQERNFHQAHEEKSFSAKDSADPPSYASVAAPSAPME